MVVPGITLCSPWEPLALLLKLLWMIQLFYLLESYWVSWLVFFLSGSQWEELRKKRERVDARCSLYSDTWRVLPFLGGIFRTSTRRDDFPFQLTWPNTRNLSTPLSPAKYSFLKTLNDYIFSILRGRIPNSMKMCVFFICEGFFSISTFVNNRQVIITVINQCCAFSSLLGEKL